MSDQCGAGPRVLVLTAPADPTADAVILQLERRQVALARFDAAQFPTEIDFTAWLDKAGGWHAHIGGVCLSTLEAIYYRRPRRFTFAPDIPDDYLNWCEGQARFGFWGVLESLPVRWVNPPSRVASAEYKPRQLHFARQAGLDIPSTLITNHPADVSRFGSDNDMAIVTKVLYARMPRDTEGHPKGVAYTMDVPPNRYSDSRISTTAHLFQAKIDRDHDVRLTVVGTLLFAVALHRDRDDSAPDWRKNYKIIHYSPCAVPAAVADGVRRLMDSLGLVFGALDFAVTADNQWIFLEINPNGQWFWLEQQTGVPISAALAELLRGPR